MSYVPEFVALYEINPFIILPLNNETIRVAVEDYIEGGEKRDSIIKKYGKSEDWNTTEVTDTSKLFYECFEFNEDISKWDTSNVTTMEDMFFHAESFNQDIFKWDTSNVTNMEDMFSDAHNFNLENAPWYHK